MRMLDQLNEHMEEIAVKDEWAYDFITKIKIQKEEDPTKKLTTKQFKKLIELHNKYC